MQIIASTPAFTTYQLDVTPRSWIRVTQHSKWRDQGEYRAYKEALMWEWKQTRSPLPGIGFSLLFFIPMWKSWTAQKQAESLFTYHTAKPDIDNLVKAFMDAFYPDVPRLRGDTSPSGDAHISYLGGAGKLWCAQGEGYIWVQVPACAPTACELRDAMRGGVHAIDV